MQTCEASRQSAAHSSNTRWSTGNVYAEIRTQNETQAVSYHSNSGLVEQWLCLDKDPESRAEVLRLRDAGDETALLQCLGQRLEFGE